MVTTTRAGRGRAPPTRGRGASGRTAGRGRGFRGRTNARGGGLAGRGVVPEAVEEVRTGVRTRGGVGVRGGVRTRGGTMNWGNVRPRTRRGEDEAEYEETENAEELFPADATRFLADLRKAVHEPAKELDNRRINDNRLTEFTRLKPPTFDGTGQPKLAEEWIDDMEMFLGAVGIGDTFQQVKLATFHLRRETSKWWRGIVGTHPVGDVDWDEFKERFFRQFFPDSAKEDMRHRFERLYQGSLSVQDYQLRFTSLARYAPDLVATEIVKQRKFRRGLNPAISLQIVAIRFENFTELVRGAQEVELNLIQNRSITDRTTRPANPPAERREDRKRPWEVANNPRGTPQYPADRRNVAPRTNFTPRTNPTGGEGCYRCGDRKHRRYECPHNRCRTCNGYGHLERNCPGVQPRLETNRPFNQPRLPAPPPQRQLAAPARNNAPRNPGNNGGGFRGNNFGGNQRGANPGGQPAQARVFALGGEQDRAGPSNVQGQDKGKGVAR